MTTEREPAADDPAIWSEVEDADIEDYKILGEAGSQLHKLKIKGEWYEIWTAGKGYGKWAYKEDTVSFQWEWYRKRRLIEPASFKARDLRGRAITRGTRPKYFRPRSVILKQRLNAAGRRADEWVKRHGLSASQAEANWCQYWDETYAPGR